MKKLILSLFLLMSAVSLKAQIKHFSDDSGTVVRNGYTYKYKMYGGTLSIYNIDSRFFGTDQLMKDGSLVSGGGRIPEFESDSPGYLRAVAIVQEAMNSLSDSERALVAGKELSINLYIDTDTGKVSEVVFRIFYDSPFRYVPVEVYRKIELDLKNEIRFTLTPHGKLLNYSVTSWFQPIRFTSAPPPTDPDPEEDLILEPVGPTPPKKPKA